MGRQFKVFLLAFLNIFGFGVFVVVIGVVSQSESFARFIETIPLQDTKIFDRHGVLIYEEPLPNKGYQTFVPLSQIPKSFRQMTIAVEDKYFYNHFGVWPQSILRALVHNLKAGRFIEGGSTITQQLARNLLEQTGQGLKARSIRQKLKETFLALYLEWHYSKDWILERYLNSIFYGNHSYGVEAASQRYFSKHVWELSRAEQALLVSLPKAPSLLNPLKKRGGFTQKLSFYPPKVEEEVAPHFVWGVLRELNPPIGSQIQTTLDAGLQKKVTRILDRRLEEKVPNNPYVSGAIVVLDVKNGDCLAMVGSRHFWSPHGGQVNGALALRHPGSALKPFTYFLAFNKGWDGDTLILDEPHHFLTAEGIPYTPKNFDRRYHGLVTAREALANSMNVPAVLALHHAGLEDYLNLLKSFGLNSFDRPAGHYGLALTLGGGAVRLVDLTNAYAALARGGRFLPWRWLPAQNQEFAKPVIEKRGAKISYLITSILSDSYARRKAFGEGTPLELSHQVAAVKTGTSHSYRDKWTIGYTPEFAVGVWVGRPDNGALPGLTGISTAAPIWHDVMELLYENRPSVPFEKPKEVFLEGSPSEISFNPSFLVVSPRPYDVFEIDSQLPKGQQKIPFEMRFLHSESEENFKEVVWVLDGKRIRMTKGSSYKFFYPVTLGEHKLIVKTGNQRSKTIPFKVQTAGAL